MPCRRQLHCKLRRVSNLEWLSVSAATHSLSGRLLRGQRQHSFAFPHSQAVKARRVATWAYLATAAIRRVGNILGFVVRAFARGAAIVRFLLVGLSLTRVLGLERLGVAVAAIAARILATSRLLNWSRDWCSNRLSGWSRWTATVASHC